VRDRAGEVGTGADRRSRVLDTGHYDQPVTVDEMAASINMRPSSFHQRFKAVTSMSPLRYQKVLRLHEARRLMLFQGVAPADACRRVGYLSPSQFSREYARFFGGPPARDIARLREQGFGAPHPALHRKFERARMMLGD
jgi:AraC-like DNA-binding protein